MNPLTVCRRELAWLCIYSPSGPIDKWLKRKRIIFGLSVVVCLVLYLIANIAFLREIISIDFSESLFVIMQILAVIANLNVIMVAFIARHKITNIIDILTEIYNASKKYKLTVNCYYLRSEVEKKITDKNFFLN